MLSKTIRNALIIGGISLCSGLLANGGFTLNGLYTSCITSGLTILTELAYSYGIKNIKGKRGNANLFFEGV